MIQKIKETETDDDVLDIMNVAVAMFTLSDSSSADERLAAVAVLDGRLENEVRNLLVSVVGTEKDAKVKKAAQKVR